MMRAMRQAIRSVVANAVLVRERWQSGVAYNPLSSRMAQDPYPAYAALRDRDPVHRSRLMNAWVFTRHSDVDTILRDHRHFSNDPRKGELTRRQRLNLPADDEFTMLFLDPPDHKRLRALVNKAFTPKAVNALEPHIRSLLGSLLDDIDDPAGGFDLMEAVAQPLPVIVIAEMLGVPPEDRERFNEWSNIVSLIVDPLLDDQQVRRVQQAVDEVFSYFEAVAEERRRDPKDDLVSALVTAEVDGERLEQGDLLVNLLLVLVAGNETTRNLIGNGALALLRNPDQLRRLRHDPGLLNGAVDELLRFDSPVQLDNRIAREPVELRGKRIAPGSG
jgi:cytochrome P450